MKITAYKIGPTAMEIVPAMRERVWMDETPDKFAYRCLPLQIANTLGYWLLNPDTFVISWNGGMHQKDLMIHSPSGPCEYCTSSFGSGIITMHPGYIFRTEKEWDTLVTGPQNYWYKGMIPLSGVVETAWLPFTFTMNWKMTEPGTYIIPKNVPLCQIYPIPHSYQDIKAEIRHLDSNPELKDTYLQWAANRNKVIDGIDKVFNHGLLEHNGVKRDEPKTHWEKNYYAGREPVSGERIANHNIKRVFPEFEKK